MTRTAGHDIIRAPCCAGYMTTPRYASVNLSALEHWTDGQKVHGLSPNDGGLRRCRCGRFFLLKNATVMPRISVAPPVRRSLFSWRPAQHRSIDFDLPAAEYVSDHAMLTVIEMADGDEEMLIVARRRHWRHLNNQFREVYREHKRHSPDGFPHFVVTAEQRENMQQLVSLLTHSNGPDRLELAELHRELGDFDACMAIVAGYSQVQSVMAKVHAGLIDLGYPGPARVRLH